MRLAEFAFVIALFLYSIAIWAHHLRRRNEMKGWVVLVFGSAFAIDVWGTVNVCSTARASVVWNLHTMSGFASLAIMMVHFSWALFAFMLEGKSQSLFSRYSPYAWGLWLVSFVTGIPW